MIPVLFGMGLGYYLASVSVVDFTREQRRQLQAVGQGLILAAVILWAIGRALVFYVRHLEAL